MRGSAVKEKVEPQAPPGARVGLLISNYSVIYIGVTIRVKDF